MAGWTAGDTGALMLGAVTSGDGTLRSDEACSSAGAALPEELVVSLTPRVVHHRTRWQAGSVAKEMAAAGAKAVSSIRRFVEFAFFWQNCSTTAGAHSFTKSLGPFSQRGYRLWRHDRWRRHDLWRRCRLRWKNLWRWGGGNRGDGDACAGWPRGIVVFRRMGEEAGLGAVSPPLSPCLPPPFVAGSSSCTGRTSMHVRRGRDRRSRRRLCFADEEDLFHSATRIVQNPCPATVVHALVVKIQEVGCD